jgi:hypothetical protein
MKSEETKRQLQAKADLDLAENADLYAWLIAKEKYVNELKNGTDKVTASEKAIREIIHYYDNLIRVYQNVINITTNETLTYLTMAKNKSPVKFIVYGYKNGIHQGDVNGIPSTTTYTVRNTKIKVFKVRCSNGYYYTATKLILYIKLRDGNDFKFEVYNVEPYITLIGKLVNQKKRVVDNFNAYCDQLINSNVDPNKIIDTDPYLLAKMFATDYNDTGYYALVASQLALLGLPTTGLNKSITVKIGNQTYDGYIFTNWKGQTFEAGKTYTLPDGKFLYIVTDQGLLRLEPGDNFTIVKIIDPRTGQALNSTMVLPYYYHTDNITADLKGYEELIKQIEELKTTVGGGGSGLADDLNNFWNTLSPELKLVVIACIVLFFVAIIFRRR